MRETLYGVAIALILIGVVMMCQPFHVLLYTIGFPVILAGVVLFNILDHLPAPKQKAERTR